MLTTLAANHDIDFSLFLFSPIHLSTNFSSVLFCLLILAVNDFSLTIQTRNRARRILYHMYHYHMRLVLMTA